MDTAVQAWIYPGPSTAFPPRDGEGTQRGREKLSHLEGSFSPIPRELAGTTDEQTFNNAKRKENERKVKENRCYGRPRSRGKIDGEEKTSN